MKTLKKVTLSLLSRPKLGVQHIYTHVTHEHVTHVYVHTYTYLSFKSLLGREGRDSTYRCADSQENFCPYLGYKVRKGLDM